MKLEKFPEQVFFSTVRITVLSKTNSGSSIGTGFLFQVPLNDPLSRHVILLVSNRHVFGDATNRIALNFHKRKTDGSGPELGQTVTLANDEFTGIYKGHRDPAVDLACINVSLISQPGHGIYYKTLFQEMLSDFSEDELLPGTSVWFVGYPENRFDTVHNLPLLRRGYIASIPTVDYNAKKQFVIDAQVFQGSSGSPVFAELGSKFKLLGIVTETMIRNEQLQAIPANVALGVQQVLGLGIVIKAPLIKELIEHVAADIRDTLNKNEPEPVQERIQSSNQNSG